MNRKNKDFHVIYTEPFYFSPSVKHGEKFVTGLKLTLIIFYLVLLPLTVAAGVGDRCEELPYCQVLP